MNRLTEAALEDMITRRVANFGETREQAKAAILGVLQALNDGKLELEVFDDTGTIVGVRDKDGYHPNVSDASRRGRA